MTLLNSDVVVPELGQVVRCRDRVWAVNDVAPSSLPVDPIAGTRPHHLVRMSSLEDDGFGDELTVIWEIEAGTEVIPHQELPRPVPGRLDPPERLDALLDAFRWGAVATADSRAPTAPSLRHHDRGLSVQPARLATRRRYREQGHLGSVGSLRMTPRVSRWHWARCQTRRMAESCGDHR